MIDGQSRPLYGGEVALREKSWEFLYKPVVFCCRYVRDCDRPTEKGMIKKADNENGRFD